MNINIISILVLCSFISACASSNKVVPRNQSYKSISFATVVDKEEITIGGSRSGVGSYVGSLAAIADSTSNSFIGLVVRGLAGSVVGSTAEEVITRKDGMLYTVESKNGNLAEVLSTNKDLSKGDCVQIKRVNSKTSKVESAPSFRCASSKKNPSV